MSLLTITWLSGAGKTTLQHKLLTYYADIYHRIIISTDRTPRILTWWNQEKEGEAYYFREREDFYSWEYVFHFEQWWNTYGLSRCEIENIKMRWKIWLIACGYDFWTHLSSSWENSVVNAFLDTRPEKCIERMKKRGDKKSDIQKRTTLFERESRSKDFADVVIPEEYIIQEVHQKVLALL